MVDAAEWRRQQEQDTDLRPVLQWVEVQQRPLVDEVAVLSKATKGCGLRLSPCGCVTVCYSGRGKSLRQGRRSGRELGRPGQASGCLSDIQRLAESTQPATEPLTPLHTLQTCV
ncbi:hypothetical protein AAFF_G00021440 [Aldrovandia affinis]|uniref:Uncharacterized protein n=1 Tax=Aldrovandia affinis TaxID=143900 RepID=A0AAD7R2H9_9TELE|nr:hypothetical protein AAFF_G00021440 [Aldrovandia affinis]